MTKALHILCVAAMAATLLCATHGTQAQSKTPLATLKTQVADKDATFRGMVGCVVVESQRPLANQAPKPKVQRAMPVAKSKPTAHKASEEQFILFAYEDKMTRSEAFGVTCAVNKDDQLMVLARTEKGTLFTEAALCEMMPDLCQATSLLRKPGMDGTGKEGPQPQIYYKRSDEAREIAGAKATAYNMEVSGETFTIWVDESRETDGKCWPFIGMKHPVLAGVYFLPVREWRETLVTFEATKVMDGKARKRDTGALKDSKRVDPKHMENALMENILKGGKR